MGKDVLNQRNGWLIDDKLSIEYGFHVDAIKGNGNGWEFNFEGKPFNCRKKNTIILRYSNTDNTEFFGFNKTFLNYHTNYFNNSQNEEFFIQDFMNPKLVNECFQIAHGIRITVFCLNQSDLLSMMEIASHYKLSNAVKFLERKIVQRHASSENIQFWTRKAIQFDLNHLLSQLMRKDDLLEILEVIGTDTPEMSGRIMKMIIANYLYNRSKF